MYYANFLKFFERARTHYLEERGMSVPDLYHKGIMFMVIHAEVTYRSPARYGDILTIDTHVSTDRRTALTFHHLIRERKSERLVVEGSATLVTVDPSGKIKRLNPEWSAILNASPNKPAVQQKS